MSFAVVFSCGYTRRVQPSYLEALVEGILPPGVPIVGCTGHGLIGTGDGGLPVEVDPSEGARGVSVLLGHVPGLRARVWAVTGPVVPAPAHFEPQSHAAPWMGLETSLLVENDPVFCLLFATGREANKFLTGSARDAADPSCFVYKLQEALGTAVVVGGVPDDRGQIYHSRPPGDFDEPRRPPRTCFAGLLLYRPVNTTAAPSEGGGSTSRTAAALPAAAPPAPAEGTTASASASVMALRGLAPVGQVWRSAPLRSFSNGGPLGRFALDLDEATMDGVIRELEEHEFAAWIALWKEDEPCQGALEAPTARVVAELLLVDDLHHLLSLEVHPEEWRNHERQNPGGASSGLRAALGRIESSPSSTELVSFQLLACCPRSSTSLLKEGLPALFAAAGGSRLQPDAITAEEGGGEGPAEAAAGFSGGGGGEQRPKRGADVVAASSSAAGCVAVSCVARGEALFGSGGPPGGAEAAVLRRQAAALEGGQLPVAGVFCDGEIGPFAGAGAWGLQRSGDPGRPLSCLQVRSPSPLPPPPPPPLQCSSILTLKDCLSARGAICVVFCHSDCPESPTKVDI